MAMIESRYASLWLFWSNRYARLMAPYALVLFATFGLAFTFPELSPPFIHYQSTETARAMLAVSNLTMFGGDIIQLVNNDWQTGMIIPQAWSLGAELWFYLLVPMLWKMSNRSLWIIVAASILVRAVIIASDLPFFPWQQRFLPAEIVFFIVGMLSFRYRDIITSRVPSLFGSAALIVVTTGGRIDFYAWYVSLSLAAILFVTLPSLFDLTKTSTLDRFVGEFSYPIYLVHITIGFFFPPAQSSALALLALSVIAAYPIVVFVERPLDRWRLSRRAGKRVTAHRP